MWKTKWQYRLKRFIEALGISHILKIWFVSSQMTTRNSFDAVDHFKWIRTICSAETNNADIFNRSIRGIVSETFMILLSEFIKNTTTKKRTINVLNITGNGNQMGAERKWRMRDETKFRACCRISNQIIPNTLCALECTKITIVTLASAQLLLNFMLCNEFFSSNFPIENMIWAPPCKTSVASAEDGSRGGVQFIGDSTTMQCGERSQNYTKWLWNGEIEYPLQ